MLKTKTRKKLDDIYEDLEANVAQIPGRRDLMQAVDLCFHSCLRFNFGGVLVEKGIVEVLVVGDTRTGKSHVVRALLRHYGHGEFISGEAVTLAGLLGGVDEGANRNRFVRAGKLPLLHKQACVIDEANELDPELIGKLSGVRSSGVYDLVKIVGAKMACMVRMLWIANAKRQKSITDFAYGVEAVRDVIGKDEDIARFDVVLALSKKDIDRASLYMTEAERPKVPHTYTADLCGKLIDWCWSRRPEHIIIGKDTERRILDWSQQLSNQFSDKIPIVIESEQRVKVARISVAQAGRLFSCDETGELLIVKPEHVDEACEFLVRVFSSKTMGYDRFSREQGGSDRSAKLDNVLAALGRDGMRAVLGWSGIARSDLEMLFDGNKTAAAGAWQSLALNGGIEKHRGSWRFTSIMIDQLRRNVDNTIYLTQPDGNRLGGGQPDLPSKGDF